MKLGFFCSPVGVAIGAYIAIIAAPGRGYDLLPFFAGISAFITPQLFWWLIVERKKRYQKKYGIIAGGLSGFFSHYLCWYFLIVYYYISYQVTGQGVTAGGPPIDPLNALWGVWALSFWSLLFFGWITIPIGAIIGGIISVKQVKSNR